ncbi:hypothetical protein OR1_00007 [Geobacter sp. OR-1]|uniref:hypothetical protein n=1 Tax=Geobacter sp. OR-1 TaxID=1266765 RepID=UPI000541FA7A|nr:hypothetical protein [Geobacter sp. OR-1]GAM07739.1 hypothetical protein OR1_00007 [Geobacter sp. OR-1]
MSTVQISYNSMLMKPEDVNPLAQPAYLNPSQKAKENDAKAIEQIKTDTVTISQEALTRSRAAQLSEQSSDKKAPTEIKGYSTSSAQPQDVVKSDSTDTGDRPSNVDRLTISSEAMRKSSILKALSVLANSNNPESAYEKLRL